LVVFIERIALSSSIVFIGLRRLPKTNYFSGLETFSSAFLDLESFFSELEDAGRVELSSTRMVGFDGFVAFVNDGPDA
jgi:hypothetical protein